ncbi:hypothetical protein OOJ09_17100 [Mesorhizobium qingshengii]|uniref:Uncharacterized protein n=1 Tax=Mesorhizobium qingshengii TaxID=1165689 RepID=A0ABT4QWD7_9HYPH|nr:hypothetical protein [Mesorhizobium qingshengii]MCZ8545909.1 hypothetical protein [Mesorhizobium qingshengii]
MQTDIHESGIVITVLLYFLLEIVGLGRQALDDFLLIGDQSGRALAERLRHRVKRRRRRNDERQNQNEAKQSQKHDLSATHGRKKQSKSLSLIKTAISWGKPSHRVVAKGVGQSKGDGAILALRMRPAL